MKEKLFDIALAVYNALSNDGKEITVANSDAAVEALTLACEILDHWEDEA